MKIILSYDISNDKLRTKLMKYITKHGHRLQYSVYEVRNSERILDQVLYVIEKYYAPSFTQSDSVIIWKLNPMCEIIKYGYAKNEDTDLIII